MTTENVRSEKDKLRLVLLGHKTNGIPSLSYDEADSLADFIIEEKRRIVQPLVDCRLRISSGMHQDDLNGGYKDLYLSNVQSIKLAGVTNES